MDEDYPDPRGLPDPPRGHGGASGLSTDFSRYGLSHDDLSRAVENFDAHNGNQSTAATPYAPAQQLSDAYIYPDPNPDLQDDGQGTYEYPDPEDPDYQGMEIDPYEINAYGYPGPEDPDVQDDPEGHAADFRSTYDFLDPDDAAYEDASSDEWYETDQIQLKSC